MTIQNLIIEKMSSEDWSAVHAIYQQGIDSGNSSFAPHAPASWEEWSKGKLAECRLVARLDDEVVGWAAFSPVSSRAFYRGVVELSIYITARVHGQGVGSALMQEIIQESEQNGLWTIQSLVFPENKASVHLHLKYGFKLLCTHEKLGFMTFGPYAGQWRDVALLERRSRVAGV